MKPADNYTIMKYKHMLQLQCKESLISKIIIIILNMQQQEEFRNYYIIITSCVETT